MSNSIEVEDVSKRFKLVHERNDTLKATLFRRRRTIFEEFWALRDVSFVVPEGSSFGLIGENGSGKSTLLKCLARIYRPNEGSIVTNGKVSALLELGAGFHPELSGRENVYLNGSILGLSQREITDRFDEIVDFSGLEHFIDSPVKNYSSGMFVRLGFAVAINVEPDILLIDEVLAVGDEDFQHKCREKVAELRRSGRTIVVVSHSMDAIRGICDHGLWLEHGHMRAVGTSGQVTDAYREKVLADRKARDDLAATPTADSPVKAVDILDGQGASVREMKAGTHLRIRVVAQPPAPGEDWAIVVELHRTDGLELATTWCRLGPESGGERKVELEIPALPLLAGPYDITVRVARSDLELTEVAPTRVRIHVLEGITADRDGLLDLGGRWTIS